MYSLGLSRWRLSLTQQLYRRSVCGHIRTARQETIILSFSTTLVCPAPLITFSSRQQVIYLCPSHLSHLSQRNPNPILSTVRSEHSKVELTINNRKWNCLSLLLISCCQLIILKGSSHKKNLSPKPHILDCNGMWNSSFWSEGHKNHLNLKFGLKVCPTGTSIGATRISRSHGAAPRGQCAAPPGPRCDTPRGPRGKTLRPKLSSLGGFQAPPTKTSYTTPHYFTRYEVQALQICFWEDFFQARYECLVTVVIWLIIFKPVQKSQQNVLILEAIVQSMTKHWQAVM